MTTRIILQAVEGLPFHRRHWHRLLVVLHLRKPTLGHGHQVKGRVRVGKWRVT